MRVQDLQFPQDMPPHVVHMVDAISFVAVVGSLAGIMPPLTALAGLIWYGMQMYDWIKRKRHQRHAQRQGHPKRRATDHAR